MRGVVSCRVEGSSCLFFNRCNDPSSDSDALLPKRRLPGNKSLGLDPTLGEVGGVGIEAISCDVTLPWLAVSEGKTAPPNCEKSALLSKDRGREGKLRSLK